jgi:hypothetical protein
MTIVTYIAQLLAAVIVGGLCVMMYLDMPLRPRRASADRAGDVERGGTAARAND